MADSNSLKVAAAYAFVGGDRSQPDPPEIAAARTRLAILEQERQVHLRSSVHVRAQQVHVLVAQHLVDQVTVELYDLKRRAWRDDDDAVKCIQALEGQLALERRAHEHLVRERDQVQEQTRSLCERVDRMQQEDMRQRVAELGDTCGELATRLKEVRADRDRWRERYERLEALARAAGVKTSRVKL